MKMSGALWAPHKSGHGPVQIRRPLTVKYRRLRSHDKLFRRPRQVWILYDPEYYIRPLPKNSYLILKKIFDHYQSGFRISVYEIIYSNVHSRRFRWRDQRLHGLKLLKMKTHVGRQHHVDDEGSKLAILLFGEIFQYVAIVVF